MNVGDVLPVLLDRVAAAGGDAALLSERELCEWPAAAVAQLKAERLLVSAPPADAVTCPGCEEDCTMPVEVATTANGTVRPFVICDKRDDVGRVAVAADLLVQWTCSPERVADALARLLAIRRSRNEAAALRWEVGVLKGTKGSAHVVLGIERELRLNIAGHSLPVVDVLALGGVGLSIERRALLRCVDWPVAAAGDAESAEQRRDRLKARVRAENAKGTRAFLKIVAEEEGISVSRLKQLVKEASEPSVPPDTWFSPTVKPLGGVSRKSRPKP